jgi:type IV pilus assembly protein PilA
VVVVLLGILGAIVIPSFLGATARARQAGAILTVGNLNKAQQSFYLENSAFALTLDELAIGIPATTNDYEYSSVGTNSGATSRAISQASLPEGSSLQGFVGAVQLSTNANGAIQSLSIICASAPGVEAVAPPAGADLNDPNACGAGQTRQ